MREELLRLVIQQPPSYSFNDLPLPAIAENDILPPALGGY